MPAMVNRPTGKTAVFMRRREQDEWEFWLDLL
jgi:hypothetical protein